MRTTQEWWQETKSDPAKLHAWLQRQYVGEMAAVNLLSEMLIRYGADMSHTQWLQIHKVMMQEATHGKWMLDLLRVRDIQPEKNAESTRRYWSEVLPAVDSFPKAAAAAYHAENMRLHRIREIAKDASAPEDIRTVFQSILPHEEWHEEVFASMKDSSDLTEFHNKGLQALNLLMTA